MDNGGLAYYGSAGIESTCDHGFSLIHPSELAAQEPNCERQNVRSSLYIAG